MVFKFGRPGSVRLAVLVDRGHREIPVNPIMWGSIPSSERERVRLNCARSSRGERQSRHLFNHQPHDGAQQSAVGNQRRLMAEIRLFS
jgi:hypothetical protein